MKRSMPVALVVALVASLAISGIVAAHDQGKGLQHRRWHGDGHGRHIVAPRLWVKGNAAQPGGTLRILALVRAPKDKRPATAQAVVHFASGDVTVTLARVGKSKGVAYRGKVTVPADQPVGKVKIDATAVVDGTTLTASGFGKIVAAKKHDASAKPSSSAKPAKPSPSHEPSESAGATSAGRAALVRSIMSVFAALCA